MAPSFDTLHEQDLHEEEDIEIDFSGMFCLVQTSFRLRFSSSGR